MLSMAALAFATSRVIRLPISNVTFSIPLTSPLKRLPLPTSVMVPRTRMSKASIMCLIFVTASPIGLSNGPPISVSIALISVNAPFMRPMTVLFTASSCPAYASWKVLLVARPAINFSYVVLPAFDCSSITFLKIGLNPSPCFLTASVSFPSLAKAAANLETSPKFLPMSPPMPAATLPRVRIAPVAIPSLDGSRFFAISANEAVSALVPKTDNSDELTNARIARSAASNLSFVFTNPCWNIGANWTDANCC